MKDSARRTVATTLILALLASLAPADAYAIVARASGANAGVSRGPVVTGLPGGVVSPVATAPMSLTPASVVGRMPVLNDAPRLAPSIAQLAAAPADAPQTPGAPEAPKAADAASPATPASAPQTAAPAEVPATPEAPVAAAPAERRSVFGGLKSLLTRLSPKNSAAPDFDKGTADRVFDGMASLPEGDSTRAFSVQRTANRWALKRFAKHVEKRAATTDDFGGPKPLGPTSTTQKVGYGLKWGLNMVGIVALYDLLLAPLLAAVPWPAMFGDAMLEAFGRVALLTQLGPADVANALSLAPGTFLGLPLLAAIAVALAAKPLVKALTSRGPLVLHQKPVKLLVYGGAAVFALLAFASAPAAFLGGSLPMLVAMEEISFRVLSFLPAFAALALTRPVMNWLAGQLDNIPDHAGVRRFIQRVMRFIGGTFAWYAYPFAAVLASFSFATAHFANWGVDPYVFFVQFTLGMVLTRLAYRSESLTSPIVAHLTFNAVMFGGPLLLVLGMPGYALTYTVLAAVVGAVYLLYNYLSHRKDLAAAKKGAFSAGKALSVAVLAAGLAFGGAQMTGKAPSFASFGGAQRPSVTLVQEAERGAAPAPLAAAPAPVPPAVPVAVESRADVIARIAPSVFRVNVGNGLGTGFIISPQGLAISNAHVTGDTPVGGFVEVVIPGAPVLRARVLAVNHDKDLALLQLPAHPSGAWRALTIAPNAPRVGEETLAIGYPMGLEQTVTRGIVSGVGRHLNMYVAHIQTDASINPGNSGGPLFNERGEVIGVNTLIVTRNGGSVGLGFSIMAPDVVRAVQQFAATGNIASGRIGVIINLSDPFKPEAGLLIEHIRPGSGAAAAGLQRGDLIIGMGGRSLIASGEQAAQGMAAVLAQTVPGQKVPVTVLRGDQTVTVEVTIDAKASGSAR